MGQCISVPEKKFSIMREGSSKRFYRSKNGNLSATFHVLDSDLRWDLLNINTATEEQLMTLPGINRVTAENIIEYRQRIGGFKKVEDLALVSGVGATKLEQFRTEICVGRRKPNNGSYNSSLTQSLESLQVNDVGPRTSPSKLVNVNTANVFQLMSVPRMTQEMAANIMHYKERKGPFKTLSDLSKVKGLPPDRLAIVKMYLTTDSSVNNSSSVQSKSSQNCVYGRRPIGHRRTNSAPSGLSKLRSCDPSTKDFYELVSSLVTRPPVSEVLNLSYLNRQVLRLASWNLQDFVVQKARNPGVQEVICRTILENCFSIIAVQEIASREALSLPLMNGFLYDTSRGLQLQESAVLYLPPEKLSGLTVTCQPFFGCFKKNIFLVGDFILPPGHTGNSSACRSGVVTDGLSHLAIPDGWKWGGAVSKHFPVWAEIFTEEESSNSNVPPLLNGIKKSPLLNTDTVSEKISAFDESEKGKYKGFWERSWPWRHHKHNIISETNNAITKENGSL
ncbi:Endonuclease/exonuclease/phosphatase family like protein [Argiope bruennichi]|uniref:Endonuclease/exonuclease/phosphatase family domain-containing protein 1 n=1 Tax=Argiope bruennichi TaxID=94029 RepID=A0A8T0F7J5_ARGBR|nr:Endonuclease/exonuclease/phosphatase family like protein [Argiope bruennichi]